MVLMRGVQCGTLYKLLGSTYTNGCNSFVFLEQTNKEEKTNTIPEKKTMLWHQRMGNNEKRAFEHYTVKAWLKVCLIALWILIFVNIAYMVNKIE
jgi:hypothetical protein